METLNLIAIILLILGIIGSVIPALPGPLFSFLSLLLIFLFGEPGLIPLSYLLWFGFFMVALMLMDYLAPIIGAKVFGASRKGILGAIFGALAGIFFFPPVGIFLGGFLGAIIGEYYEGKKGMNLLKAGMGVLVGSVFMIFFQTIFSIAVAVYLFRVIF